MVSIPHLFYQRSFILIHRPFSLHIYFLQLYLNVLMLLYVQKLSLLSSCFPPAVGTPITFQYAVPVVRSRQSRILGAQRTRLLIFLALYTTFRLWTISGLKPSFNKYIKLFEFPNNKYNNYYKHKYSKS